MRLPQPRGPVSTEVVRRLNGRPHDRAIDVHVARSAEPEHDEDLQLALWVLYELHHRSFEGVDDGWEWNPPLLVLRQDLEAQFEASLRNRLQAQVSTALAAAGDVADRLFGLTGNFEGPPLSEHVQRRASRSQIAELLLHRSIYQLKEADAYTWVVPRLEPAIKARLMELQLDEYGNGRPERVHQTLFAHALHGAGLDPAYGAYVNEVPAITLASSNAVSMLGLHRRLRAAALGHLAAVESTSSLPSRRIAAGIRRVGFGHPVAHFFDEHVEADAVHEQLAVRGICGALVETGSEHEAEIVFGALVCLDLEAQFGRRLLAAWADRSRLTRPVPTSQAS
jgi:hypothetical protein